MKAPEMTRPFALIAAITFAIITLTTEAVAAQLMANWGLVVVIIHGQPGDRDQFETWETVGVFPTKEACFAALEDDQLAHDRLPKTAAPTERYYRCNAPVNGDLWR